MVNMKRSAMRKNLTQAILKSLGRYIAIVAIVLFFSYTIFHYKRRR